MSASLFSFVCSLLSPLFNVRLLPPHRLQNPAHACCHEALIIVALRFQSLNFLLSWLFSNSCVRLRAQWLQDVAHTFCVELLFNGVPIAKMEKNYLLRLPFYRDQLWCEFLVVRKMV